MWSDGAPMTAADFVYGIQEGCSPDNASPYQYVLASGYAGIVGCNEFFTIKGTAEEPKEPTEEEIAAARTAVGAVAVDDTTIEITVERPTATFATILSLWVSFPSRQDLIEQFGADWTKPENFAGNGPFIMTEYVAQDHVSLVPNPNWALEPKPLIQSLTIQFIDDLEAAFRGFQAGDLDITQVGAQSIPVIEGDDTLNSQFLRVGSGRIETIEMNLERPPLDNFDVRLALSQAMDREAINQVVYNNANIPALFWVIQGLAGHVGNEEFGDVDFNPEAARESLARAGFPDGEGFPTLTLLNRDDPTQRALGEFLQNQWKEILNIDVELEFVDAATRSARFNGEDFDLFRGGWAIDYPDIENVIGGLFNTDGGNNHYNCSDPEIDAKIAEAQAATDNDARIAAWSEAGKLIVHKLCGTAPFAQLAQLYMVGSHIGGVVPNGALDAALPGDANAETWYVKAQ
jgi:oligopeptide transport system substrate-binding protein